MLQLAAQPHSLLPTASQFAGCLVRLPRHGEKGAHQREPKLGQTLHAKTRAKLTVHLHCKVELVLITAVPLRKVEGGIAPPL